MSSKPRFEVLSHTDVALILGNEALKEIHVLHELAPLRECAELRFGGQPSLWSWLACQPNPLYEWWPANRSFSEGWWRAGELNPRPLRCERSALPTELAPHLAELKTRAVNPTGLVAHERANELLR